MIGYAAFLETAGIVGCVDVLRLGIAPLQLTAVQQTALGRGMVRYE